MKKITVKQFKDLFYPDADLTLATIRNWLRNGHLAGEKTPSGIWFVIVPEDGCPFIHSSRVNALLKMMEK
ncbi:hypothetical protein ACPV5W_06160 [Vibrio astriarenae]